MQKKYAIELTDVTGGAICGTLYDTICVPSDADSATIAQVAKEALNVPHLRGRVEEYRFGISFRSKGGSRVIYATEIKDSE